MKLSLARQNQLTNSILERLLDNKFLTLISPDSRELLFSRIKNGFSLFNKEWEEIDQAISHKIHSIKRGVLKGSSEWDVLYDRFLEEHFRKKSSLFRKK